MRDQIGEYNINSKAQLQRSIFSLHHRQASVLFLVLGVTALVFAQPPLLIKRLLYGIGGAIPVWLILSGDEDKGVSGGKVGPPPEWPDD